MNIGVNRRKTAQRITGIAELSTEKDPRSEESAVSAATSPDAEAGQNNSGIDRESAATVGSMLRIARQNLGHDIPGVASHLRIRPEYLEALEAGDMASLPGKTYAIGYVRTYANFLGTEALGVTAERAVEIFKQETRDIAGTTELAFPSPAPEGKVPGGAIMLVSAFLAIGIYGGWYYLSSNEISLASHIPAVGEKPAATVLSRERVKLPAAVPTQPLIVSAPETKSRASEETTGSDASQSTAMSAATPQVSPDTSVAETTEPPGSAADNDPSPERETVDSTQIASVTEPAPEANQPTNEAENTSEAASRPEQPVVSSADPSFENDQTEVAQSSESVTTNNTDTADTDTTDTRVQQTATLPATDQMQTQAGALPVQQPDHETGQSQVAIIPDTATNRPDGTGSVLSVDENSGTGAATTSAIPAPPAVQSSRSDEAEGSGSIAINSAHAHTGPTQEPDNSVSAVRESRVTIRATGDSWVQIRDGQSRPIVTRVMREGEELIIPDQPGLELFTGNAGALEILVDGKDVPEIGPWGQVRRNVSLDPALLINGLASTD